MPRPKGLSPGEQSAVAKRETTVYYECPLCKYRLMSTQRCGPAYLQCYDCGTQMAWKPMKYR